MVQPSTNPLEKIIEWQFIASEQHNQVRYGTWRAMYYKQFLPGGIVISGLHPPKLISKAVYEHARKVSKE